MRDRLLLLTALLCLLGVVGSNFPRVTLPPAYAQVEDPTHLRVVFLLSQAHNMGNTTYDNENERFRAVRSAIYTLYQYYIQFLLPVSQQAGRPVEISVAVIYFHDQAGFVPFVGGSQTPGWLDMSVAAANPTQMEAWVAQLDPTLCATQSGICLHDNTGSNLPAALAEAHRLFNTRPDAAQSRLALVSLSDGLICGTVNGLPCTYPGNNFTPAITSFGEDLRALSLQDDIYILNVGRSAGPFMDTWRMITGGQAYLSYLEGDGVNIEMYPTLLGFLHQELQPMMDALGVQTFRLDANNLIINNTYSPYPVPWFWEEMRVMPGFSLANNQGVSIIPPGEVSTAPPIIPPPTYSIAALDERAGVQTGLFTNPRPGNWNIQSLNTNASRNQDLTGASQRVYIWHLPSRMVFTPSLAGNALYQYERLPLQMSLSGGYPVGAYAGAAGMPVSVQVSQCDSAGCDPQMQTLALDPASVPAGSGFFGQLVITRSGNLQLRVSVQVGSTDHTLNGQLPLLVTPVNVSDLVCNNGVQGRPGGTHECGLTFSVNSPIEGRLFVGSLFNYIDWRSVWEVWENPASSTPYPVSFVEKAPQVANTVVFHYTGRFGNVVDYTFSIEPVMGNDASGNPIFLRNLVSPASAPTYRQPFTVKRLDIDTGAVPSVVEFRRDAQPWDIIIPFSPADVTWVNNPPDNAYIRLEWVLSQNGQPIDTRQIDPVFNFNTNPQQGMFPISLTHLGSRLQPGIYQLQYRVWLYQDGYVPLQIFPYVQSPSAEWLSITISIP